MRFHVLLPMRDEADVLPECLSALLLWADKVYLFDTGSVDNTWEIAEEFARTSSKIVLLGRQFVYFSDTKVRGWMFEVARRWFEEGDWFLRADADEFHHVPPPDFVRTHMKGLETVAYHQYYDFQFSGLDLARWEAGEETLRHRGMKIEDRRRYYTISNYSEPRLCRYRASMKWPASVSFPFNAGYVAEARLPIRHYPHRDPFQMKRRYRLRSIMMSDPENRANWTHPDDHHWSSADWRQHVCSESLNGLHYWAPGQDLPLVESTSHLAGQPKRLLQQILYCSPVGRLDKLRPGWKPSVALQRISSGVQRMLEQDLRSE